MAPPGGGANTLTDSDPRTHDSLSAATGARPAGAQRDRWRPADVRPIADATPRTPVHLNVGCGQARRRGELSRVGHARVHAVKALLADWLLWKPRPVTGELLPNS